MKQNNLEKIWWWDPTGFASWQTMEDIQTMEPARCVTIAEVVYETDLWIVTSASHSNLEGSEQEYADVTIIPKGCIEKRQPLELIKEDTHAKTH